MRVRCFVREESLSPLRLLESDKNRIFDKRCSREDRNVTWKPQSELIVCNLEYNIFANT